jgi:type IV pilus assembly protein PilN
MARINLLPWRETQRKQRQREFGALVGAAVVITLLLAGYSYMYIQGLIEYQGQRNAFLKAEIAKVDQQIRAIHELDKVKARLLARMKVIERLQSSRPLVVHLFDELVKALPDGLYLTSVVQRGNQVTLQGQAQSNARISALMRNAEASQWLGAPQLTIAESRGPKNQQEPVKFTLVVHELSPKPGSKQSPAVAGQ